MGVAAEGSAFMSRIAGAGVLLALFSVPAFAQAPPARSGNPIHKGSLVIAGASSVSFERMSPSGGDETAEPGTTSTNSNITFINGQAVMTYYPSEKFGIGPVL